MRPRHAMPCAPRCPARRAGRRRVARQNWRPALSRKGSLLLQCCAARSVGRVSRSRLGGRGTSRGAAWRVAIWMLHLGTVVFTF